MCRLSVSVAALLLLPTLTVMVHAHIWVQCPSPRNCFYEKPLSSADPDGEWRRAPCPFSPGARGGPHAIAAGRPWCLRVREFVDHVGYWDVTLATRPVGPHEPQSLFTVPLVARYNDSQNGTSLHNFEVQIPRGTVCRDASGNAGGDAAYCTIQVRQWSDDLDWYYYACVDVRVVADSHFAALTTAPVDEQMSQNCTSRIAAGTCSRWEAGPPAIRITILESIVLGTVGLVCAIGLVVTLVCVCCCHRGGEGGEAADASSEMEETQQPAEVAECEGQNNQETNSEEKQEPEVQKQQYGLSLAAKVGIAIGAVLLATAVAFAIAAGVLVSLKNCDYDTSSELSL